MKPAKIYTHAHTTKALLGLFIILNIYNPVYAQHPRVSQLIAEKQAKMKKLEKCKGTTKGLKIAGISTLGVTAVGIAGNIAEAVILDQKKTKTAEVTAANETLQKDIEKLEIQYQKKLEKEAEEARKKAEENKPNEEKSEETAEEVPAETQAEASAAEENDDVKSQGQEDAKNEAEEGSLSGEESEWKQECKAKKGEPKEDKVCFYNNTLVFKNDWDVIEHLQKTFEKKGWSVEKSTCDVTSVSCYTQVGTDMITLRYANKTCKDGDVKGTFEGEKCVVKSAKKTAQEKTGEELCKSRDGKFEAIDGAKTKHALKQSGWCRYTNVNITLTDQKVKDWQQKFLTEKKWNGLSYKSEGYWTADGDWYLEFIDNISIKCADGYVNNGKSNDDIEYGCYKPKKSVDLMDKNFTNMDDLKSFVKKLGSGCDKNQESYIEKQVQNITSDKECTCQYMTAEKNFTCKCSMSTEVIPCQ